VAVDLGAPDYFAGHGAVGVRRGHHRAVGSSRVRGLPRFGIGHGDEGWSGGPMNRRGSGSPSGCQLRRTASTVVIVAAPSAVRGWGGALGGPRTCAGGRPLIQVGKPWWGREDLNATWHRGCAADDRLPSGRSRTGGAEIHEFLSIVTERAAIRARIGVRLGAIEGWPRPGVGASAVISRHLTTCSTSGCPTTADRRLVMLAAFQQFGIQPGGAAVPA